MSFYDTREWKIGDNAQRRWAYFVSSQGGIAVPIYGFEGNTSDTKAPMLISRNTLLVAPDLLVLRGDVRKWNEVKAKASPTWRYAPPGPRWEHGFDWALLEEYRAVSRESGCPVFIVVHELRSPLDASRGSPLSGAERFLAIDLEHAARIGQHRPDWPGGTKLPHERGRNGQGGLLWPRSAMTEIQMTVT